MDAKQQPKKFRRTAVTKAVKNINNFIRVEEPQEDSVPKVKAAKSTVADRTGDLVSADRGVVYLGHIPHGFYEEEIKSFFAQFGHVTRIHLARSKKTGNSKGFAFVEFRFKEVAQVVAETMNNYLMKNRLLKATYIPPEKQHVNMFLKSSKIYGPETCQGFKNRQAAIKAQNKYLTPDAKAARVSNIKQQLISLQEKLKAQGVDCVFQVDDGTSKRLFEETKASLPPSKRAKTTPLATKADNSKLAVSAQETNSAPVNKKASKGQISQKIAKSVKIVKSADEKVLKSNVSSDKKGSVKKPVVKVSVVKKPVAKKTVEKKTVEKKNAVKKVVGKKVAKKVGKNTVVAKAGSSKKDGAKKTVKKQVLKKK